jgi:Bacterial sugar transferase
MGLIWGSVLSVLGLVAAVLIPVAVRLITDDFKEWLPWITCRLIARAVSRLPESERERLEEEWWSHVNEWPGSLAKIYVAYGYLSASKSIDHIVRFDSTAAKRIQEVMLRAMDIVIAAALLLFTIPLLCMVALCIKLESPGPVLVSQRRVGRNGQTLGVWKFRSMRLDDFEPIFQYEKRPRVTRVGSFLRKTALDEMPTPLAVLRGDMTLVGKPRRLSWSMPT